MVSIWWERQRGSRDTERVCLCVSWEFRGDSGNNRPNGGEVERIGKESWGKGSMVILGEGGSVL